MKRNKVNNSIGLKYYKYNGDNLEIIRILKYYNDKELVVLTENNEQKKITSDELNTYMKLNSDGLVIFNIVNLGNSEDVMVSLHRRKDIANKKIFPYMICRQNVKDIFDYTIRGTWNDTSVGMCISEDTTPQGYDYKSLFQVSAVIETQSVNVYIDDTLDTILKFIKHKNINQTLVNIKAELESFEYLSSKGACTTIEELLTTNDFMMDFDRGYNIITLDTDLSTTLIYNCLHSDAVKLFAEKTSIYVNPHNTFIIEYDKTIDLSKIEEEHALLRDKNGKLYIMLYNNGTEVLPSFANDNIDIMQHYKLS